MNVMSPGSVPEALDLLASDGAAVPIAGGTDLLVHWPVRVEAHERTYVDLSRLDSLRPLRWTADELLLGGLTTYWDVIRDDRASQEFPLLVDAARQVGAIQIQARGTWAGNIVNASPAADGVPVLMAYDAVVVLESRRGREEVPLDRFYSGYKEMKRRPDQLVVGIRLPRRRYSYQVFEKVGGRSEEHTSELQSQSNLVCRLLLEKNRFYQLTTPQAVQLRQSPRSRPHRLVEQWPGPRQERSPLRARMRSCMPQWRRVQLRSERGC